MFYSSVVLLLMLTFLIGNTLMASAVSKYRYSFIIIKGKYSIRMGSTTASPTKGLIYVKTEHFYESAYINKNLGSAEKTVKNGTLVTRSKSYAYRDVGVLRVVGTHKWFRDGEWITRTSRASTAQ